ncbi:MAG: hypothetical protein QXX19_06620 [Candidatus Caldarchaeum sp.]
MIKDWNPSQKRFIECPARYAAFIGGMGSGKTSALCRRAVAIATKYPGSEGVIARYTWGEVNEILVPQFFEVCPPQLVKKWKSSSGYLELWAGPKFDQVSVIYFINLENPARFRGRNLSFFAISQADDPYITETHWIELCARLRRRSGPYGPIPKQFGFLEGNYNGHSWIWKFFTKEGQIAHGLVGPDGRDKYPDCDRSPEVCKNHFHPSDYFLVEASTLENAHNLPVEYLQSLESMPEEWKKRYYFGSWDEIGGLVYKEFKEDLHTTDRVWDPVSKQWLNYIPSWWWRFRSIDHGVRNPTVCLFAATSPSGTVYIYDEYYGMADTVQEHARAIKEKSGNYRYMWTVIDPSAFNKEGTSGVSAAHVYTSFGIPVAKCRDNKYSSGIPVVKRYMNELDPETGRPRLQIIRGKCPNLIREIKEYIWHELPLRRHRIKNQPEKPRKYKDHSVDALRYLLVSHPSPTPIPVQDIEMKDEEPWF